MNKFYTVETYPFSRIAAAEVDMLRVGRPPKRQKRRYLEIFGTFDIETTNIHEIQQSVMYIWQMCIDGDIIIGRTWAECKQCLDNICSNLPPKVHFIMFVHNLAFEFQFLRNIYNFSREEVFAVASRKVVKCDYCNIEFRCSYFLTNMSLNEFLKKMQVPVQKLELDYSKYRFAWTPLNADELAYDVADVLGLWQAITKMLRYDNETLTTMPISSTGYVRKDFKHAMSGTPERYVQGIVADYDLYVALRRAFRGGNTHANKWYAGCILHNVTAYDRASSYPDVIVNMPYPVKRFRRANYVKNIRLLPGKVPAVMRITFEHIRLKDIMCSCPYISRHKCTAVENPTIDNGRIMSADRLTTYLTDIDLGIVQQQYDFDKNQIAECWLSEYGDLPDEMKSVTMEYYRLKTELKNVEGQEVYYMKSKNKLNSIYGMTATNPVRTKVEFNGIDFEPLEEDERKLLAYANRHAFTAYQWGVWVTAWARYWLQRAIDLCGDNFVYCDTDSVYYIGEVDFSALNSEILETSKKHNAAATDPQGVTHYLGVYEHDKDCKTFCTLGAKKYAYTDNADKLHITIAGVNKKLGAVELGKLENFKEGFIFTQSAGLEAVYNDVPYGKYEIDGHALNIGINIYLHDSMYTLSLTDDYRKLISLDLCELDKMHKCM